jgi:predicted Zn-dependent protease with MMP-like domain
MRDEPSRPPLSPLWWEQNKKNDADEYNPRPLSPVWWNEHEHRNDSETSLLHPLGLNNEKIVDPDRELPASVDEQQASVDEEFQQRVNAAYETLPQTIRALPDFPPIEILEEPRHSKPGREILGCFFGIPRSEKSNWISAKSPTVIHVYRGPVIRYAGNQWDAVLKTVVWHEVAHWLGFQTEQEVAELGLQLGSSPNTTGP